MTESNPPIEEATEEPTPEVVTVRIERLAYGPFGVARTDEGTIMVAAAAPGDLVRANITARKKSHREAEILEVLEPGPSRRTPPCQYVPACGGCTWQHLEHAEQLRAKEQSVRDQLVRIGRFTEEELEIRPILSVGEWNYRHRLTLRVDDDKHVGFYRHRTHDLVEIERCMIAEESVSDALVAARAWVASLKTVVRRIQIATAGDAVLLVANAEGKFDESDINTSNQFLTDHPEVKRLTIFGRGWRHTFGTGNLRLEIDDTTEIETSGSFTQVTTEGNRLVTETVTEFAQAEREDSLLDLYSGAGNLTFALAKQVGSALAVDVDAVGIRDARKNAERLGLTNVRTQRENAGRWVRNAHRRGDQYSLVVLDPPRNGAKDVVGHLSALGAKRIVYVSCHPATLARDVRILADTGFTLKTVQPIDLFAQTFHVEAVALLERS